ncbi:MAG: NERD domain-containing protein [Clostridium sp.]
MSAIIFENINPRDKRTEGEEKLLNVLKYSPRFDGWTVFEQPHIDSIKPDFILLNPKKGVIIIEVKDWNLNLDIYKSGGYIKGTDGRLHKKDPVEQVETYKNCILKSDLNNSEDFVSKNNDYYGYIETVVYFHGPSKEKALEFCTNNTYTKIWTDDDIDKINDINKTLNKTQYTWALTVKESKYNKDNMLENMVHQLIKNLQCADYNYERKVPFKLFKEQSDLANLKQNSIRRWGGVPGAGKSLVLAEKAARALKKDYRVLILTYNITLRHYLKDLYSQQFGLDDRRKLKDNLSVLYFHEFLKIVAASYCIKLPYSELYTYNNKDYDFTQDWIKCIEKFMELNPLKDEFKYDYILIDEGQDFRGDWIRFLKKFYTQKGELFIVYDKSQDIYEHGIWIEDSEQIKNIGFKGKPGYLKISYRLPKEIVEKIELVRKELGIHEENILTPKSNSNQISLLISIKWINSNTDSKEDKLNRIDLKIKELLEYNKLEDITILTTNENTGVDIVKFFMDKGIKVSHVYDMNKKKNEKNRRNEKWKFRGGTGRLKVCSYHSYKGWQTPNIILVLDSYGSENIVDIRKNVGNAIFISMSRVKPNSMNGQFSFTCFNYLPEYNFLEKLF